MPSSLRKSQIVLLSKSPLIFVGSAVYAIGMITFVHYKQWADLQELKHPKGKRLTDKQQENLNEIERQQNLHDKLAI
jgi:hypothetical protein